MYHSPGTSPPPQPAGRRRAALVVTLAAVVVTVLAITGVIVVVTKQNDTSAPTNPGSAPSTRKAGATSFEVAWQHPMDEFEDLLGEETSAKITSDVVGDVVVVVGTAGIRAYDVATGEVRWEWEPPDKVCTHAVSGDAIYLSVQVERPHSNGTNCTEVVRLGVEGDEQWRRSVHENADDPDMGSEPVAFSVTDDQLVVVTHSRIKSLAVEDGATRWSQPMAKQVDRADSEYGWACGIRDAVVGAGVIATAISCLEPTFASSERDYLLEIRQFGADAEPTAGDVFRSNYELTKKLLYVDDDSVVLWLQDGLRGDEALNKVTFVFFDGAGKQRASQELGRGLGGPGAAEDKVANGDNPMIVNDDLLVAFPVDADPVAYRISTGQPVWELNDIPMAPSSAVVWDGSLLVPSAREKVMAFDPETGDGRGKAIAVTGIEDVGDQIYVGVNRFWLTATDTHIIGADLSKSSLAEGMISIAPAA